MRWAFVWLGLLVPSVASAQRPSSSSPTTLVILGVDHSAQLGSRAYHPGYFRAFFERVHPAALCVERGYHRLEWWVLDWNAPSIGFYESIGAVAQDEWTRFRLDGGALDALAAARP